jgi:pimeloyl-ACP methyl ester carboxylesterase
MRRHLLLGTFLLASPVLLCAQGPAPAPAPTPTPAAPTNPAPASDTDTAPSPFETITRTLPDGIVMTADLYRAPLDAGAAAKPILVCMHMTGSSRGEYKKIAPKVVALGFNVLAVDLRCGGPGEFGDRRTKVRSGTMNETWKLAMAKLGRPPSYLEAYPDVVQSVLWAHELFPTSRVGLLGSSYSASFALVFGAEHEELVDAVLAYSPGEYMEGWSIADRVKKLDVPAYITCGGTQAEMNHAKPIAAAIEKKSRLHAYWPEDEKLVGDHGSHALILKGGESPSLKRQWDELEKALAPLKKPLEAAEIEKRKKAAAKVAAPPKQG